MRSNWQRGEKLFERQNLDTIGDHALTSHPAKERQDWFASTQRSSSCIKLSFSSDISVPFAQLECLAEGKLALLTAMNVARRNSLRRYADYTPE